MSFFKHLYHKFRINKIIKQNIDYSRDKHDDREVLEKIIFPYILSHFSPRTILDIGREDYQAFYNEIFAGREFWTIDRNPEHAEFGAPDERHVVDDALNLKKHFQASQFDLVIMNGVIGWGLNRKREIEQVVGDIHGLLKPGGLLVIGYNDFPDVEVVKPESLDAVGNFKKFVLPPLGTDCFKCSTGEHVYNFYVNL